MNDAVFLADTSNEAQRAVKLSNFFFVLAVVFGVLLIFLEPPFVCPDENAHFINICRISRGGLFADMQDGAVGSYISEEELDFLNRYGGFYNGQENPNRFDYDTMRELSAREPSNEAAFYKTHLAALNPTAYLLSSAFVALVRLIVGSINAYTTLWCAKLANLLFYAFVIRWAIQKTGAFRNTMFLLALMPMAIFQGASTSYDAILIPAAFLLFAYATKILLSPAEYRITREDIVAICFASACICGVKIAYAPLILILLSIHVKKFGSWKRWGICVGMVAAMGIVFYVAPTLITGQITHGAASALSEAQMQQEAYFKSHLGHFPSVILHTVDHFGKYWIETFIGVLGWLDTFFPTAFTVLFFLISTFNAVMDACGTRGVRLSTRLLSLAGVAIFFVGTLYTMYVRWNPELFGIIGGDLAFGGQGRYFIPVALFTVLAVSNPLLEHVPFRSRLEQFRTHLIGLTSVISLSLTVLLLTVRYWI